MKSVVSSWIVWSILGVVAVLDVSVTQAEDLTDEKVRQLLKELQPSADEPWRSISWRIDLLAAQRDAVNERKPIFIWAMDGHPLGCT